MDRDKAVYDKWVAAAAARKAEMYANANPVNNTDPTGLFSLGETTSSLFVLDILNGTVTLNYALTFQMLMNDSAAATRIAVNSFKSVGSTAISNDTPKRLTLKSISRISEIIIR